MITTHARPRAKKGPMAEQAEWLDTLELDLPHAVATMHLGTEPGREGSQ
jgi:hypothetical protein